MSICRRIRPFIRWYIGQSQFLIAGNILFITADEDLSGTYFVLFLFGGYWSPPSLRGWRLTSPLWYLVKITLFQACKTLVNGHAQIEGAVCAPNSYFLMIAFLWKMFAKETRRLTQFLRWMLAKQEIFWQDVRRFVYPTLFHEKTNEAIHYSAIYLINFFYVLVQNLGFGFKYYRIATISFDDIVKVKC